MTTFLITCRAEKTHLDDEGRVVSGKESGAGGRKLLEVVIIRHCKIRIMRRKS
jgi:hypothetical protein